MVLNDISVSLHMFLYTSWTIGTFFVFVKYCFKFKALIYCEKKSKHIYFQLTNIFKLKNFGMNLPI
jgi:hypothetical protein